MQSSFKSGLLTTLLWVFIVSAVICLFYAILGDISSARLFATATQAGLYSLLAYCCTTIFDVKKLRAFSIVGLSVIAISFLFILYQTWKPISYSRLYESYSEGLFGQWKLLLSLFIFCLSFAHISLLLSIHAKNEQTRAARTVTIISISVLTLIFCIAIGFNIYDSAGLYRFAGILFILNFFGTGITFVLHEKTKDQPEDYPAPTEDNYQVPTDDEWGLTTNIDEQQKPEDLAAEDYSFFRPWMFSILQRAPPTPNIIFI